MSYSTKHEPNTFQSESPTSSNKSITTISFLADYPQCLHQITTWSFDEWGDFYPKDTKYEFERDFFRAMQKDSVPFTLVALRHNELVGTASVFINDELPGFDHLSPWLAAVFVKKENRNQGIGDILIQAICNHLKSLQYSSLYLWTESKADWYKKKGWVMISETLFNGKKVHVMKFIL